MLPCDWTFTQGNPSHLSWVESLPARGPPSLLSLPLLSRSALLCCACLDMPRSTRRGRRQKNKKNRRAWETQWREWDRGRCEVWRKRRRERKAWEKKRGFHSKAPVRDWNVEKSRIEAERRKNCSCNWKTQSVEGWDTVPLYLWKNMLSLLFLAHSLLRLFHFLTARLHDVRERHDEPR